MGDGFDRRAVRVTGWPAIGLAVLAAALALLAGFNQTTIVFVRADGASTVIIEGAGRASRGANDVSPDMGSLDPSSLVE